MCKVADPPRDGVDKVTIVGAGMVGIACANAILFQVKITHQFNIKIKNKIKIKLIMKTLFFKLMLINSEDKQPRGDCRCISKGLGR